MGLTGHPDWRAVCFIAVLMIVRTPLVQAATPPCGTTLTKNTTLDSDMNCPSRAIRFLGGGSKKVTLDCAGFSISSASDRVISADSVSKITIKNCAISTTHSNGRGIVLTKVTNSKIIGNLITTTGDSSRGLDIRGNSKSNLISSNTVNTAGSSSNSIRIRTGSNKNKVINNRFQADASYAVSIRSASTNTLTGNIFISPNGYLYQGRFNLQNGGMSVDSAGNIYAVENNWGSSASGGLGMGKATAFFRVDPNTGVANSVLPLLKGKKDIGFGFDALEVLPNGRVLALSGAGNPASLYEIDPVTGKVTTIALNLPVTLSGKPNALEATSDTNLLATTNQGELLNIDLTTSNVTEIGQQGIGWTGIALHPTNGKAYVVSRRINEVSNTAHLYEINVNTGTDTTEIGDTGIFSISDIDFALDGTLYGNSGLEVINITTGLSTTVGSFGPDPLEPLSRKNRLQDNLFQTADGSIQFTDRITLPSVAETDISRARVEIIANQVMVDSGILPFLDEKARITLNNITGTYRNLLVDSEDDGSFEPCGPPRCKFVSLNGGPLVFDVNGFTTYSSVENTNPSLEFIAMVARAEIKAPQAGAGASTSAKKKLKAAEKDLAKALKYLKKGNISKGLTEIGKSVADLNTAVAKGAPAGKFIDALVEASKAEAQTAIDLAIAVNVDAALIAAAEDHMLSAQDKLNEGKPDKAIAFYQKAWLAADKAVSDGVDTLTLDMSPLRIVGFSDDRTVNAFYRKHPLINLGAEDPIPLGKNWLLRVRDPYGMGDFYAISVWHGWGAPPFGPPTAGEGEPDNDPANATELTRDISLDRDLNPLFDEDWFSFTADGVQPSLWASTMPYKFVTPADPMFEVYDSTPNLGPVTYVEETTWSESEFTRFERVVVSTFDSINNLTLVTMNKMQDNSIDVNSFSLVFSGPPEPGDYPVVFAAPPLPGDFPASVTGSVHIYQYNGVGKKIIGSFDITIEDGSRTTTVSGSFNVKRERNEPGLLTGFGPALARGTSPSMQGMLKEVSAYMRRD